MAEMGAIRTLRVTACHVPITPPIETAGGAVPVAPLILIDITMDSGIVGRAYLFTYTPLALRPVADLLTGLEALIAGQPLAPVAVHDMLKKRFRLLGTEGLVQMALAGIDMALWDALAQTMGLPLARLLGAETRPVATYITLRAMSAAGLAREAEAALIRGFTAFKFRFGQADLVDDLALHAAMRDVVGPKTPLMVDFNQSLSIADAKRRLPVIDELGLTWIEEPTSATDYAGQAEIRRAAKTPIQAGENWWGPEAVAHSIAAGATDLAMPDIMKIGGVTGWQRAAGLAAAAGLPVSSHLFPEFSRHCLAATQGADKLEFLDLAAPILAEPVRLTHGRVEINETPGAGLQWNEAAVARYAV